MKRTPNVLWIMTDQHRADCLGCMGHPVIQTPNLDRVAREGVVFENAFCQSPACMASRGSLLTGRYPEAIRVRGMGVLPPAETTFPEHLKRHGYRTGAFGKVHLTPEQYTLLQLGSDVPILDWRRFARDAVLAPIPDDPCKRDYGFDVHVGCDDACQGNFRAWLRERYPAFAEAKRPAAEPGDPRDVFVSPFPSECHQSTYIARQAEAFVRGQAGPEPWFAFCSFVAPHHPFEAPADQIARYDGLDIPLPSAATVTGIPEPAAGAIGETAHFSEAAMRRVVLHYLASISLVDDNVGRLLQALEDTGQMENTVIVFVADHAEFLGNRGLLRKPSIHVDELIRVPLLLRLPGATAAGRRVNGMVELVDVYPTLLGLLGIPVNPGVQGMDWSGALRDGSAIAREDIYADMFNMHPLVSGSTFGPFMAIQTLRTDDWKLNVYPTAGPEYGQLFNLRDDPGERTNLYADPAHRDTREAMLWRLLQRVHRNIDPLPLRLTQW